MLFKITGYKAPMNKFKDRCHQELSHEESNTPRRNHYNVWGHPRDMEGRGINGKTNVKEAFEHWIEKMRIPDFTSSYT